MGMIIHPYHHSIGSFFHEDYIFDIPKYQRNYAWGDLEVEDFVKDLRRCYEARSTSAQLPHFFGGIVSIEERLPGGRFSRIHIIDGQQRLATFVMLASSVILSYKEIQGEIKEKIQGADQVEEEQLLRYRDLVERRVTDLTRKYICFEYEVDRQIVTTQRVTASEPDRVFFETLPQQFDQIGESDLSRESHRRLYSAFGKIKSFLTSILESLPEISDKIDALKRIEETLDEDFTVIHMVTETKAQAYRLFQVLNDRGTGLTVGDLLRARTLEMLDPAEYRSQQETIQRVWDDILADHPNQTEDFLRWYYASTKGKRPGKVSLLDDFLEAFFPQNSIVTYVVRSQDEAENVVISITQLQKAVRVLRALIEGDWPYPYEQSVTQWHRNRLKLLVVELKHTNCMPLLLAAATTLDHRKFSETIQLVERFVFRYKIISNQHVSALTKIYNEQALAIRAAGSSYRVTVLRDELRSLQVGRTPDSVFRTHLNELIYKTRGGNKPLKYFLMTLEHYVRWYDDGASGQPQCRDTTRVFDFANTTIEHIYPQNSDNPVPELETIINSLGNLTFLGPNDNNAAGNKDFSEKKAIFQVSSVSLNRKIGDYSSWDKTSAEERQEELVELALRVFSV